VAHAMIEGIGSITNGDLVAASAFGKETYNAEDESTGRIIVIPPLQFFSPDEDVPSLDTTYGAVMLASDPLSAFVSNWWSEISLNQKPERLGSVKNLDTDCERPASEAVSSNWALAR